MMTTLPSESSGTKTRVTQVVNASPFIGPSSTQSAIMPVRLRPTTKVVFRCPCGTPFAAWCSAKATRHVRRYPGLINEDELLGVEIDLTIEPFLAPLQDGCRGDPARSHALSFLRAIPRRANNRHIVPSATTVP
jgi:hypothetical protein